MLLISFDITAMATALEIASVPVLHHIVQFQRRVLNNKLIILELFFLNIIFKRDVSKTLCYCVILIIFNDYIKYIPYGPKIRKASMTHRRIPKIAVARVTFNTLRTWDFLAAAVSASGICNGVSDFARFTYAIWFNIEWRVKSVPCK